LVDAFVILFLFFYSFEGRKKRVGSKEKLEHDKLQHKIKREMKGAIREIRKDNAFLGRQKIKEQIERYFNIEIIFF
jgi:nucleolar protein 14